MEATRTAFIRDIEAYTPSDERVICSVMFWYALEKTDTCGLGQNSTAQRAEQRTATHTMAQYTITHGRVQHSTAQHSTETSTYLAYGRHNRTPHSPRSTYYTVWS